MAIGRSTFEAVLRTAKTEFVQRRI